MSGLYNLGETARAEAVEATELRITDGAGNFGGLATLSSTPPATLGPLDFQIDPSGDPYTFLPWSASLNIRNKWFVINNGLLYQNQSGGTVLTGSTFSTLSGALVPVSSLGPYYNSHKFTANGTFTVPAGVTNMSVTVVGGGGSGSSGSQSAGTGQTNTQPGGGGGGGGGGIRRSMAVTPGDTITFVLGAGGVTATAATGTQTNGANGVAGNFGGNSTMASTGTTAWTLLAAGGSGGAAGVAGATAAVGGGCSGCGYQVTSSATGPGGGAAAFSLAGHIGFSANNWGGAGGGSGGPTTASVGGLGGGAGSDAGGGAAGGQQSSGTTGTAGSAAAANTGHGGGGGGSSQGSTSSAGNGGAGGSGYGLLEWFA